MKPLYVFKLCRELVSAVREVAKAITEASVRVAKVIDAHAARTAPACLAPVFGRMSGRRKACYWRCSLPRGHAKDHIVRLAKGLVFEPCDPRGPEEAPKA